MTGAVMRFRWMRWSGSGFEGLVVEDNEKENIDSAVVDETIINDGVEDE